MEQNPNDPIDSGKGFEDDLKIQNHLIFTIQHFSQDQTISCKTWYRIKLRLKAEVNCIMMRVWKDWLWSIHKLIQSQSKVTLW